MSDDFYARMVDEEWDRAEAEYLEQVNLATGEPLTRLVPPAFPRRKPDPEASNQESKP